MYFILFFYIILWFLLCSLKIKQSLHIIQLEGYKSDKYMAWVESRKDRVHTQNDKIYLISLILFSGLLILTSLGEGRPLLYSAYGNVTLVFLILSLASKEDYKKPLVFTPRAVRLYIISLLLLALDLFISLFLVYLITGDILSSLPVWAGILSLIYYLSSYYMYGANYIAGPIEKRINDKYYQAAYKKIRSMEETLISLGITGSYGKTSTKFAAASIIKEKYKVLTTPDSYNTPMGLSKIINNDLTHDHEVFVAELGATKLGDIAEVADLTNPKIGIITSIGPCHLETFKSLDNIMRTKYELIECLPDDGVAIFNYDNEYVKKLADKTFKEKLLYGIEDIEARDVYAADIRVDRSGSTFSLGIKGLGTIQCTTRLLGRHNILNILAGAAAASVLGLSLGEISRGISKLEAVDHRLQLIDPGTGVLVIDDAFNSNPDGARAALEVLNSFTDRRKIIVTPGMVELGHMEERENFIFGENIASICDIAILIGKKRTLPIYQGIKKHGFKDDNLYLVNSLNEATEVLKTLTRINDVVLFENDLPDTYDEK